MQPSPRLPLAARLLTFSDRVGNVLLNARKPSIRCPYPSKCNKYLTYLSSFSLSVQQSSLRPIFNFLLQLKDGGLGHSSLKVYLSAISTHHELVEGKQYSPILCLSTFSVACGTFTQRFVYLCLHGICCWFFIVSQDTTSNLWLHATPDCCHGRLHFWL